MVWHQRLDRYKFLEFQILDKVLGILVNVELVEVLKEDVLSGAHLLGDLALGILLLRHLVLVLEVRLHEGHLTKARVSCRQGTRYLELVDDRLHL